MISGTYCRDEIQGSFHEKIEVCRRCDFYLNAHRNRSVSILGVVVDTVSEVLNVKAEEVEDVPNMGARVSTEYIKGMSKSDGRLTILLDIDQISEQEESVELMRRHIKENTN